MSYAAVGRKALPWVLFVIAIVLCAGQGAFVLSVATVTLLWIVLASGLNVIMGHGGLVNFGIGAFYGIGSYAAGILAVKEGMPIVICLVAGIVIAAVAAAIVGPLILARTRGFQFAIATLAVGIVVDDVFNNWTSLTGGVLGIVGVTRPGWLEGTKSIYFFIAICAVVTIAICDTISRRRLGVVLRALRDDQFLGRSLGFRPLTYQLWGFVVSGAIAGFGGVLYAYYIQYVSPSTYGLSGASFEAFAIVAFGGIGTTWGPVIGAVLLTAVDEFVNVTPEIRLIFYGVALLLVVMVVPEGIVPGSVRLIRHFASGRRDPRRIPALAIGGPAEPESPAALVPHEVAQRQPPESHAVDQ